MWNEDKRPGKTGKHVPLFLLFLLLFSLFFSSCSSIDKKAVESEILGEKRVMFVRLPENYKNSAATYPVLYILDGHRLIEQPYKKIFDQLAENEEVPDVIMVGIANKAGHLLRSSRDRDFNPDGMGAQNFLKFMKKELIPFIDENYRTNACRVLMGHSSAGLFTIFALFSDPGLFSGYIPSCPALSEDDKTVFDMARTFGMTQADMNNYLFIGMGAEDYSGFIRNTEKIVMILKTQDPEGLIWEYYKYPGETHNSTPYRTFSEGVIAFFRSFPEGR
jgi:predicted alpha/beta superfamily hydrolase